MREIAGQFAQRVQLLGLLLDACDFTHAVQERGDGALRHRGNGCEHGREQGPVKAKRQDVADREADPAVCLHARERHEAGNLPGTPDKERQAAVVLSLDMDFTMQQEHHRCSRLPLMEQDVSRGSYMHGAMVGKPAVFGSGEPLQGCEFFKRDDKLLPRDQGVRCRGCLKLGNRWGGAHGLW